MAKKAKKSKPKPHKAHKAKAKPKVHKVKTKVHKAKAKHVVHAPVQVSRPLPHIPVPMPTAITPSAPVMVVPQGAPMPAMQVDRVHLQNISFEIASMRRTLERMLQQLEKLEAHVSERRDD